MLYQFAILARAGIEWNGSKLSRTHGEQRDSGAPGVVFCDKKNLVRIVHTGSDQFQNRADAIELSRFTTRRRQADNVCAFQGKDVIAPLWENRRTESTAGRWFARLPRSHVGQPNLSACDFE